MRIHPRRSLTATVLGSALLLAALGESAASAQTAVTVSIDARAAGTPLKRVWPFFGYDEVNYTTLAQGKSLLTTIGKLNSVPAYIRPHFLLNTGDGTPAHKWGSTNVYTEDGAGNPVYSWTIQDGIMDTIAATGNLPLAEIGFMPQALSSHPNPYRNSTTTALDGGCFYPPKDYDKWAALIGQWATHSKARYPSTVNSWLWEMWNEPNIRYWYGTDAEYFKLYDYTEAALHGVLPDTTLGGPAVLGAATMLRGFLQHCDTGTNAKTNRVGTRLDLVTFHAKGGVALSGGHPQMDLGNQLRIHRDAFTTIASFPKYKQTPIVITEADPDGCAACSNAQNAYRNSPAYGAYEVSMMKRSLDLEASLGVNLKGLVTWAFMFDDDAFFSVLRTLATGGIDKPVLNAFKLLGALNGQRLPATSSGAHSLDDVLANGVRQTPDIDAIATLDGSKVQVLVWNYHDDLVAAAVSPVHLTVSLPASFGASATVTHLRVDESHGDAYTVWLAQGSPKTPSATQRTALEQAMQPATFEAPRSVAVTNGSAAVDFDLPRFGISLLTFSSPTAPDVDAGTEPDAAVGTTGGEPGSEGGAGAGGGSGSSGQVGADAGVVALAGAGAGAGTGTGTGTGTAGSGGGAGQGLSGGPAASSGDSTGCGCSVLGAHVSDRGLWLGALNLLAAGLFVSRARTTRARARRAREPS
jgi:xylan 1,4-beta-xylosidase